MQDSVGFLQPDELDPWEEHQQTIRIPIENLPAPIEFRCAHSNLLYPTHPLQQGKEYHQRQVSRYAPDNLDGRDVSCASSRVRQPGMPQRAIENNIERFNRQNGADAPLACRSGARVQRIVLSYTYIDECGNYYRGVWTQRLYGQEQDSTLWARGIETPGGRLRETFALPYTDFDFLLPLFRPGMGLIPRDEDLSEEEQPDVSADLDIIANGRRAALANGFRLSADELLFIPD